MVKTPKVSGLYVPNWHGIDVAVVYYMKELEGDIVFGGANPGFLEYPRGRNGYKVHVVYSPLPIKRDEVIRVKGQKRQLKMETEPPGNIQDLIKKNERLKETILEYLGSGHDRFDPKLISKKELQKRKQEWLFFFVEEPFFDKIKELYELRPLH